ncbi:MAG: sugar transferase [Ignavibacteriales bacterium]|nr:sugar transferase [Ignavibacteriales bacterium]
MYNFLKRFIDLLFSSLALLALLPFFIVISAFIYLQSGRPIFYKQARVGRGWKSFKILKFRTMVNGAEKIGPKISCDNDKRITPIGKFLRKYKFDELPQLINVFKGDMSIVGPRPEVPKFVKLFSKEYSDILKVKPGLSDFASIKFSDEASMIAYTKNAEEIYKTKILPQKIVLYRQYLNEMSLLTDFKIIFATVKVLVR